MADHIDPNSGPQCVLVTGGSGFFASHIILQPLGTGFIVHTTIRSPTREKEVRDAIQRYGEYDQPRLSIFVADLTKDDGWAEAMVGCSFVPHVASPFPSATPRNEDDLSIPA